MPIANASDINIGDVLLKNLVPKKGASGPIAVQQRHGRPPFPETCARTLQWWIPGARQSGVENGYTLLGAAVDSCAAVSWTTSG